MTSSVKEIPTKELIRGIKLLTRRVEELEKFDPNGIESRYSPEIDGISARITTTIEGIFGADSSEWDNFINASDLDMAPASIINETRMVEIIEGFKRGKSRAISLLGEAIRYIEEELEFREDEDSQGSSAAAKLKSPELNDKIFIVHGHDDGAKNSVARLIEKIGLKAIILHEIADQSQTIIEKFEKNSDVGFAIVILSPDDVGQKSGASCEVRPRARQNVVLELGYFVGKIGRSRVCALKVGDIEVPSDYIGVLYKEFDPSENWKAQIALELKNAGYNVDMNKVFN